jgi:nucleoside-diphosphate-sugar epimerase
MIGQHIFIVLGENGFLGRNIVSSLRSQNLDVLGISRSTITVYSECDTVSLPFSLDEVRGIIKSFTPNLIVINCVRENLSIERVEFYNLLTLLSKSSAMVLNFSSYIQYYELGENSQLAAYQKNQSHQSKFLEASCKHNRFVDVALFTVFGHGDSQKSFLSSLVSQARSGDPLELTGLEQLVSYTWIGDVVILVNIILNESDSTEGRYSFWPEPPVRLLEIVQLVLSATKSRSEKRIGLVPYKGHELFIYKASWFPAQIIPEFDWTSFNRGFSQWVPIA